MLVYNIEVQILSELLMTKLFWFLTIFEKFLSYELYGIFLSHLFDHSFNIFLGKFFPEHCLLDNLTQIIIAILSINI